MSIKLITNFFNSQPSLFCVCFCTNHISNYKVYFKMEPTDNKSVFVVMQSALGSDSVEVKEETKNEGLDLESSSPATTKPFSFYMSILCLCIIVLLVAWEAASLAAAMPVCKSPFLSPLVVSVFDLLTEGHQYCRLSLASYMLQHWSHSGPISVLCSVSQ